MGGGGDFRLDLFFLLTKIQCFLVVLWGFGYFQILGQRELKNLGASQRDGGIFFDLRCFLNPW